MDKNNLPEDWKLEKLSLYVDTLETGSRPRGGVSKYTSGVPSISAEQILPDGSFYWDKIKYVPESFYESTQRGHIKEGDILIVKDGATTGKVAYVGSDFPYPKAMVNEHTFIIRVSKTILKEWVHLYLKSHYLIDFRKRAREKGIIGGLTQSFPEEIEIPVPPLPEQRRIVARIEQSRAKAEQLKQLQAETEAELANFVPALLAKAFRGEL